jgi:hypothetical protein
MFHQGPCERFVRCRWMLDSIQQAGPIPLGKVDHLPRLDAFIRHLQRDLYDELRQITMLKLRGELERSFSSLLRCASRRARCAVTTIVSTSPSDGTACVRLRQTLQVRWFGTC